MGNTELREAVAFGIAKTTARRHRRSSRRRRRRRSITPRCRSLTRDEVITHAPGWPTILDRRSPARRRLSRTTAATGFALTAQTPSAVTPKTRDHVNSPGNPTGALLSEAEAAKPRRERRGIGS